MTVARPVFADSNLSLSSPAGSFLALDRISTRLWIAWTTCGSPALRVVQLWVSSVFFAAAAVVSSLMRAGSACAAVNAAW